MLCGGEDRLSGLEISLQHEDLARAGRRELFEERVGRFGVAIAALHTR